MAKVAFSECTSVRVILSAETIIETVSVADLVSGEVLSGKELVQEGKVASARGDGDEEVADSEEEDS